MELGFEPRYIAFYNSHYKAGTLCHSSPSQTSIWNSLLGTLIKNVELGRHLQSDIIDTRWNLAI